MAFFKQAPGFLPPLGAETAPAVDPVEEKAAEIDDNVQRLLNQAMQAATAENLRAKAAAQVSSPLWGRKPSGGAGAEGAFSGDLIVPAKLELAGHCPVLTKMRCST